jgi:hypothetical protein
MSPSPLRRALAATAILATTLSAPQIAVATAQRTFVSTTGVDNPACSIATPCRSFGAAVTAANAGGEVIVLDSGGYGAVTITKAIAIIAPSGVYAGVSVLAGDGVTVTTSNVGDRVTLNGLTINNQGAAGSGIVYNGVGRLLVINTVVNGFSAAGSAGLNFTPTASSNLRVENSEFRVNATGINIQPPSGASTSAVLDKVIAVSSSGVGIYIQNQTVATLRDVQAISNGAAGVGTNTIAGSTLTVSVDNSELSNNNYGITPGGDAGTEIVSVQNCNIANNVTGGIRSDNASTLRLANSTITGNPTGLITSGTGQIISMGNNWIQGNTTNGTPTSTLGGS